MTKRSRQYLSRAVFLILDQMGTNHYIKGVRKNEMSIYEKKINTLLSDLFSFTLTGSTAEGIVPQLLSDFDFMAAINGIVSVEDVNTSEESAEFVITKSDYMDAPPGYCRLAFGNADNADYYEDFCYIDTYSDPLECKLLISSLLATYLFKQCHDLVLQLFVQDNIARSNPVIQGPAITQSGFLDLSIFGLQMTYPLVDIDIVVAIYFYGKRFLTEWVERPRFHDWPPAKVIKEVSSMEGYLVPVGERDSENATLYWRISYVTAEKKLLACFNSTLDKVYVMLKMLTKKLCSAVCPKFSSYMVKNVVLWVAETNQKCTEDMLIDLFLQCLNFLKVCLHNNHLPNYMIPKRNLLAGRIVGKEKTNLIMFLSDWLDQGEEVVQIFPRLSEYITSISIQPEMFLCYGMWRNYVETLFSRLQILTIEYFSADNVLKKTLIADVIWGIYQDERYFDLNINLLKLLVPNYIEKVMIGQLQEVLENRNENLKEVLNIYPLDKAEIEQSY